MAQSQQESDVIHIDGSTLEGGGQILRNSVAFATLLSVPIEISKIRHNRSSRGLKAQHVEGLKLAANICNAETTGIQRGSDHLIFIPKRPKPGHYLADPGTAGSITLLLQISLPCLLFSSASEPSESVLTLRGGTNATSAPQIDYTIEVFLPFLRRHFHVDSKIKIKRRGYYPKGGGEIMVTLPHTPGPLPAFTLTSRGNITAIRGISYIAGSLPKFIPHKMAGIVKSRLSAAGLDTTLLDIQAGPHAEKSLGNASGIILWAETNEGCVIAGSAIGQQGTSPAQTAEEAADELLRNLKEGGCVDEYLQDQIIIFMALAKGRSTVATGPLTLHTKTAIWVAEKLTRAKFMAEDEPGDTGRVLLSCDGIGLESVPELTEG